VFDGAFATQTVHVLGNRVSTITGPTASRANGIVVYNRAVSGASTISQALVVAGNSVSHVDGNGIQVTNLALYNSLITQGVAVGSATVGLDNFGGNTVTNVGLDGIQLHNAAIGGNGAKVSQTGSIIGNVATNFGHVGIGTRSFTSDGNSFVYQSLAVTNNTATGNGQLNQVGFSFGARADNTGAGGVHQSASLISNTATNNGVGLDVKAYGTQATQVLNLSSANVITQNFIGTFVYASDATQTFDKHGPDNTTTGNSTFNFFTTAKGTAVQTINP
jgi:hypothetical protein